MTKTKPKQRAAKPKRLRSAIVSIDPDELLRIAATKVNENLAIAVEFREVARLSEALASIAHQARQATKQVIRDLKNVPLDQIVAYLKTLPEEKRDAVARELAGDNDEESLL